MVAETSLFFWNLSWALSGFFYWIPFLKGLQNVRNNPKMCLCFYYWSYVHISVGGGKGTKITLYLLYKLPFHLDVMPGYFMVTVCLHSASVTIGKLLLALSMKILNLLWSGSNSKRLRHLTSRMLTIEDIKDEHREAMFKKWNG